MATPPSPTGRFVYLHFLDRELNQSVQATIDPIGATRALRTLLLLTDATLYCGLSAIWENDALTERALEDFQSAYLSKNLLAVSRDLTLPEFLASRQEAYQHDVERYPRYFTSKVEQLMWLEPTWRKASGSTGPLVASMYSWAGGLSAIEGRFVRPSAQLGTPVVDALNRREGQAVTFSYFRPFLDDVSRRVHSESLIRRQISEAFTSDYLRMVNGDIATGSSGLQFFDGLARHFPMFDLPLLAELASVAGLSELLDPLSTSAQEWQLILELRGTREAHELASIAAWILAGLADSIEESDSSSGDHVARRQDMLRALRSVSSMAERRPLQATNPSLAYASGQQRLMGLAHRLERLDGRIAQGLERNRILVELPDIDVLIVTVNDVETQTLHKAFEEKGYVGRPEFGDVNSYLVFGSIGDATVATVRSSMGSGGQGGSTLTVGDAIRELRPGAILAVGVAFGVDPEKQHIGQLLLSERLASYELQRVGTDRSGSVEITERGPISEASPRLLGRFRDGGLRDQGIDVKAGLVLSGEKLLDNRDFKNALMTRFPEAIGGEMEGAGIQAASGRETVEWLVAKAVCDYAANKSENKALRQRAAAEVAARATLHVLERGGMAKRRGR